MAEKVATQPEVESQVEEHDHSDDEINPDKVSVSLDDVSGNQSLVQAGSNERKTTDGLVNVIEANLGQEAGTNTGGLRGVNSLIKQFGADNPTFGVHTKVRTAGTDHNQGIGFYAEIDNEDGAVGDLPPTCGVYLDSRGSTVRPWGAFVDDGASSWQHGVVLNGDYSDTLVRHSNFTVEPDGSVTRGLTDDPQPRLRELYRNVPASGTTETFNLNTEIPRTNDSWMVHVSSDFDDSRTQYSDRGFEGQFKFYSGYDSNGDNFHRVTNIIPLNGFHSSHTCSMPNDYSIDYSGGTVNYRSEIVVKARKLS